MVIDLVNNVLDDIAWSFTSIGNLWLDNKILTVFRKAGLNNVGVSLIGGIGVDVEETAMRYKNNGLYLLSGDLPDINWNMNRLRYDWEMVNRDRPKRFFVNPMKWFNYFGMTGFQFTIWRWYGGVRSEEELIRKIEQFYTQTSIVGQRKWLRWDSRSVIEQEKVVAKMNKIITESDLPAICLAVEYYPESHHPEGYRQMIRVMWHKYSYIKTVISFDPVHYARIKDFYPGASIFTPEEYLFKLIKDDNMVSLWRMLEVSNINTNGRVAHTSIKGQINFENIFLLLGYALRERLIKKPFQVVCEISPMILWPFLMNGTEMIKTWTRCLRSEKGSQILLKEMSKKINRKNETY